MPINEYEQLEECLTDLGCSKKERSDILQCRRNDDIKGTIRLLRKHRQAILDEIHREEKQISCLDCLVFRLEKELEKNIDK